MIYEDGVEGGKHPLDDVNDAMAEQARAWVSLLLSGAATHDDARDLILWRASDQRHEAAFARAARVHGLFHQAAAEARAAAKTKATSRSVSRRWIVGAGIAASAAGVAVLMRRDLTRGREADFSTAKGESRRVELAAGVVVEMNTLTRIALRPEAGAGVFELLDGEAVVSVDGRATPLAIFARQGQALTRGGRLALRCLDGAVKVSCLEGEARVRLADETVEVPALHSVTYNAHLLPVVAIDEAAEAAWREGRLVFRQERLGDVIAEINRYRDGRIIIADPRLSDRRVNGVFYTRQIDQIIDQIRLAYGVTITRMPGDIVLLA